MRCPSCENEEYFTVLVQFKTKIGFEKTRDLFTQGSDYETNSIYCDKCGYTLLYAGKLDPYKTEWFSGKEVKKEVIMDIVNLEEALAGLEDFLAEKQKSS